MRLLERIANTRMSRRKHPIPIATHSRRIQLNVHQLIHILQNHHIAIQLYNTLILHQRKLRKLAPAIIEPRIIRVVLMDRGNKIRNPPLHYTPGIEGCMAVGREGVRVEDEEGVLGVGFSERVLEG